MPKSNLALNSFEKRQQPIHIQFWICFFCGVFFYCLENGKKNPERDIIMEPKHDHLFPIFFSLSPFTSLKQ